MAQYCLSAYCVVDVYTDGCLDWDHSFGRLVFCRHCFVFPNADAISAMNVMSEVL